MKLFDKIRNEIFGSFLKDKDFKELIKGSSSAFILKIASMALGYFIMIFLTNKFGAKVYGEYALGITVLSIVVLLPRFGLDTAMVRLIGELKLSGSRKRVNDILKKAFGISGVIGLAISLIFFFFSSEIAIGIFKKPDIQNEMGMIKFILIPMAFMFLIAAYFQAYKKVVLYILFNAFLLNIVFFITLLVLEVFDVKYQPFFAYGIALVISFLIGLAVLFRTLLKKEEDKVEVAEIEHKSYKLKEILKISSPMLLSSSFVLLINWLDVIMLGLFSTEEGVGIYNASQRLATLSGITLFAINAIATPKFVEFFAKKDFQGLALTAQRSTKLIFYTSAPILLAFIFFPKFILGINGSEFVAGYMALIFLCLGKFVNSISGSVGYILQMTNNQKIFQNVLLIAALINAILNYILIPKFGFNGAAFASMITIMSWNIALVIIIKRKLGFWTFYLPLISR